MGKKLSPPDNELYRKVDEVLHYVWDPIGVAGEPMARDEYYSYLPQVFQLLIAGATAQKIADFLHDVTTKDMEFNGNRKHDEEVAEILIKWKNLIYEKAASQFS
jgi:hypothetical protein